MTYEKPKFKKNRADLYTFTVQNLIYFHIFNIIKHISKPYNLGYAQGKSFRKNCAIFSKIFIVFCKFMPHPADP